MFRSRPCLRRERRRAGVEIVDGIGAYQLPGIVDRRGMFRLETLRMSSASDLSRRIMPAHFWRFNDGPTQSHDGPMTYSRPSLNGSG